MSASAAAGGAPDFAIIGASGFLGAAILRALEGAGCKVAQARVRLQDRQGIERFLDEHQPSLGVVCAAGERGRPNVAWCDTHPVETMDANITGQLNVAAACHARKLHVTLLGTGAMYVPDASDPTRRFTEKDAPNMPEPGTYVALRHKMEELLAYFDNALVLRVVYPMSSDLDPRGLIGKLARFKKVDRVVTSVTILEDLCPLIPELARRRVIGPLNFVNSGTISYAELVGELAQKAPPGWRGPAVSTGEAGKPAAELDVAHFAAAVGREIPDASTSLRRIIHGLAKADFAPLVAGTSGQVASAL